MVYYARQNGLFEEPNGIVKVYGYPYKSSKINIKSYT